MNLNVRAGAKKILATVLVTAIISTPAVFTKPMTAYASTNQPGVHQFQQVNQMRLTVDDRVIDLNNWPGSQIMILTSEQRTYLPARALIESVGGTVGYTDGAGAKPNQRVAIIDLNYDGNQLQFIITSENGVAIETDVYHNGVKTDGQAVIINGRTLVPVRLVLEKLNLVVDYDEATTAWNQQTQSWESVPATIKVFTKNYNYNQNNQNQTNNNVFNQNQYKDFYDYGIAWGQYDGNIGIEKAETRYNELFNAVNANGNRVYPVDIPEWVFEAFIKGYGVGYNNTNNNNNSLYNTDFYEMGRVHGEIDGRRGVDRATVVYNDIFNAVDANGNRIYPVDIPEWVFDDFIEGYLAGFNNTNVNNNQPRR